jgi:hypothetical protein
MIRVLIYVYMYCTYLTFTVHVLNTNMPAFMLLWKLSHTQRSLDICELSQVWYVMWHKISLIVRYVIESAILVETYL